ncbi:MAG: HK97 gp10 family phage protein [Bacillaceae bacterium]|nr:HK97 gp10 family phage protein [Bacillaceae bacterium]
MAKIEIEGIENVVRELEKLGNKGRRIENTALKKAGETVQGAVQAETPTRTGQLKESIAVSNVKTKGGVKHVEVGPNNKGWYGKFVEFGTVKMKANPFMSRGYEKSKGEAMDTIRSELKKGLGL